MVEEFGALGEGAGTLRCRVCHRDLELSSFTRRRRGAVAHCKVCVLRWGDDLEVAREQRFFQWSWFRYWRLWGMALRLVKSQMNSEALGAYQRWLSGDTSCVDVAFSDDELLVIEEDFLEDYGGPGGDY